MGVNRFGHGLTMGFSGSRVYRRSTGSRCWAVFGYISVALLPVVRDWFRDYE